MSFDLQTMKEECKRIGRILRAGEEWRSCFKVEEKEVDHLVHRLGIHFIEQLRKDVAGFDYVHLHPDDGWAGPEREPLKLSMLRLSALANDVAVAFGVGGEGRAAWLKFPELQQAYESFKRQVETLEMESGGQEAGGAKETRGAPEVDRGEDHEWISGTEAMRFSGCLGHKTNLTQLARDADVGLILKRDPPPGTRDKVQYEIGSLARSIFRHHAQEHTRPPWKMAPTKKGRD